MKQVNKAFYKIVLAAVHSDGHVRPGGIEENADAVGIRICARPAIRETCGQICHARLVEKTRRSPIQHFQPVVDSVDQQWFAAALPVGSLREYIVRSI